LDSEYVDDFETNGGGAGGLDGAASNAVSSSLDERFI
jgi:hypothetical protein